MLDFKKTLIKNLVAVGVAVVIFLIFFFLFRLDINHQVEVIQDLQGRKTALSQSAENLSLLIKEWETAKKYKERVNLLIPPKDKLVSLSNDFQKIAQEKNVNLSFNFGKEADLPSAKGLGSVSFVASLEGSFSGILAFLKEIEEKYYSLKISSFDLMDGGADRLRININGQVFFSS
ncbi:MAG: hypothetical protein KatS3mg098_522 [Candidatus Parcubacteria bacterium]|nr:MAG: hypothetical protein KatS3mg098_522 [Candidatus Parcubacteria bacterium]